MWLVHKHPSHLGMQVKDKKVCTLKYFQRYSGASGSSGASGLSVSQQGYNSRVQPEQDSDNEMKPGSRSGIRGQQTTLCAFQH